MNDQEIKEFQDLQRSIFIEEYNQEKNKYSEDLEEKKKELFELKLETIEKGWIETEKFSYNLFREIHKIEKEEAERMAIEKELLDDNSFIPALICKAPQIISYNHAIDYHYKNGIKHVFRTDSYKEFQQIIFKQLYNSNIKAFINKERTEMLQIDLRIKVKNIRKDVDNVEKTIIDTVCQFLGINDNKIKIKNTSIFQIYNGSDDKFFIKFKNITKKQLQEMDF